MLSRVKIMMHSELPLSFRESTVGLYQQEIREKFETLTVEKGV